MITQETLIEAFNNFYDDNVQSLQELNIRRIGGCELLYLVRAVDELNKKKTNPTMSIEEIQEMARQAECSIELATEKTKQQVDAKTAEAIKNINRTEQW